VWGLDFDFLSFSHFYLLNLPVLCFFYLVNALSFFIVSERLLIAQERVLESLIM
jgi:hypothetical protein